MSKKQKYSEDFLSNCFLFFLLLTGGFIMIFFLFIKYMEFRAEHPKREEKPEVRKQFVIKDNSFKTASCKHVHINNDHFICLTEEIDFSYDCYDLYSFDEAGLDYHFCRNNNGYEGIMLTTTTELPNE